MGAGQTPDRALTSLAVCVYSRTAPHLDPGHSDQASRDGSRAGRQVRLFGCKASPRDMQPRGQAMAESAEDIHALSHDLRTTLSRAHDLLGRLTYGDSGPSSRLSRAIAPVMRIKKALEPELIALELLAQELGI